MAAAVPHRARLEAVRTHPGACAILVHVDRLQLFDRKDLTNRDDRLACRCRCVDNHDAIGDRLLSRCAIFVDEGDVCDWCADRIASRHAVGRWPVSS